MNVNQIDAFVRESNRIEGLHRVYEHEIEAARRFLALPTLTLQDVHNVHNVQSAFAPGHVLRDRVGLDVRVGDYIAPRGGPMVRIKLGGILDGMAELSPWRTHVAFEMLHPYTDGNGRTGRILWAWHMLRSGQDPFRLGFLHSFYYQTLEASGT